MPSLLRSRRNPADTGGENVQPVSEADHRAIEWLRSQGIDPRDHTPGERVQMWRQRDVPPFDPSSPEERYANSPDEWTGNYDPIPYRPSGPSPGWQPSEHDARTPAWYDQQYGHWGSLIRQLEGGQDWGPYRRLEAAQRLEQLGPDLVEQYGHGFDPTAGIEAGDYTGERDTRAPAAVHDPAIDGPFAGLREAMRQGQADAGAYAGLDQPGREVMDQIFTPGSDPSRPSDAMPLPFLEPRSEEERAAQQAMEADRARQQGGAATPPPSAARRWGITPPPLRMSTTAAEMPGPNTAMTAAPSGVPGGFAGKNWYYGNQGALAGPMEPQPAAPTPAPPLQSQKGREGPKKSPADVRFPIQAVLDQTGMSLREISRQVGASPSQLRDPRGLTVDVADRVAVALGAHPVEFWPDFHAGIDTSDVQPQSANPGLAMPGLQGIPGPNTAMSGRGLDADPRPWWMKLLEAHNGQPAGWMGIDPSQKMPPGDPGSMTVLPQQPPPYDWGGDPDVAGPNTMMNAADAPSEGTRPPFPTEWDVNNPEHRQRHFEDVYSSLLDQLAGNYGHDAAHEAGADLENMPRVGPGSAYSQGRDVKRPGDFGLPPWFSDDGTTNERRDWLVQHPEYQVAPDFTDQQDYPVDIPYENQDPQGGGFGWRQTHFGGDEFDRYWAGPQRGVGKADQAGIVGEQQSRKFQPPSSTAMVGASSQPYWRSMLHGWGNGNTAMSTTSPDGGDIPDWMTPQDVTDAWSTYPPMPDPTNPRSAHPSGGGGGLPPGYQPYVPGGEQPKPTTHVPVPWDTRDPSAGTVNVPVDPGYDDRYVEGLNMGDQMKEWLDAAAEAQRNNQPLPPMPGGGMGDLAGGFGLSAMGGGAAVPRHVGGFASQFRPQALGGYQAARPLAPMGGFNLAPVLPRLGGTSGNVPRDISNTSMNADVYASLIQQARRPTGPRHSPFDGMLDQLYAHRKGLGQIGAVGAAVGGAVLSGAERLFSPFGG